MSSSPSTVNRCEVCLIRLERPKTCSKCKIMKYCSVDCQRVDWYKNHKFRCSKPVDDPTSIVSEFGFYSSGEIMLGLLNQGPLVAKVRLPSKKAAQRLLEDKRFMGKVPLIQKHNAYFVDVLTDFVTNRGEDRKTLKHNVTDGFFSDCINACALWKKHYLVDRSVEDYLKVILANKKIAVVIGAEGVERCGENMDFFEFVLYTLHWMSCQALVMAGEAKLNILDFEGAEAHLAQVLVELNHLKTTAFTTASEGSLITDMIDQVRVIRERLPRNMVAALTERRIFLKSQKFRHLEVALTLRNLGLEKIKMGDVDLGRKDLIRSLNAFTKFHEVLKDRISTNVNRCDFLCRLGEAYHYCALYAAALEPTKQSKDVLAFERKALEHFVEAGNLELILNANIILWNWYRNRRVFTRFSEFIKKHKHPLFDERLPDSRELLPTLKCEIRQLMLATGWVVSEQCSLCRRSLQWNDPDDEPCEILIQCKHAFHSTCLDVFFEKNKKECPTCHIMLSE